jgi:ABC-type uncharacterized transport system ATPase subunit
MTMHPSRRLRRTSLTSKKTDPLKVEQKQTIFKALVDSQDGGKSVVTSRTELAKLFSLSVDQIIVIEYEGLDKQWPPL